MFYQQCELSKQVQSTNLKELSLDSIHFHPTISNFDMMKANLIKTGLTT
jgi:hypothetical protein